MGHLLGLSKLLEDRQFGFKQAHGTEIAIFVHTTHKQYIDFYCNQDTPVYMCILDAKGHLIELIIGH